MTSQRATCRFCEHPAIDRCPRCTRARCAQHSSGAQAGSWPSSGYKLPDLCPECLRSEERNTRKVGRVAVTVSAGVAGMVVGALAALFVGGALGLGADVTVLFMLIAELGLGGLSAYATNRQVKNWLLRRDQKLLSTSLPEARLLE